ncbi:Receptor-like protein kinase 7 [Linum perenne]
MLEGDLHELKPLTKLASLHLFENQLSGEIPQEIGELKGLTEISLYRNKLVGSIPQKIGSWADFYYIDVSENFLTGQIPPDMCKKGNTFSGTIPASLGSCISLSDIDFAGNLLSGNIPEALGGLKSLNSLNLSSNKLSGEIPPNGSLWDRLHSCDKVVMDWELRYAIALGSARGLEYLHHGFDRPVIHRDVKSSNILLDEEWNPRIADFGLAKILHGNIGSTTDNWSHGIAGTHGYMAPDTSKINEKSDVYSFGVVLLELVTGKRPINEPEFGEKKDIVEWVYSKLRSKESIESVMDSNISDSLKENAVQVLKVAVRCTANIPTLRPSMRMVVQMLEEAEPHTRVVVVGKEGEKERVAVS